MWIWTLVHSSKTEVNLNQRQKQWRNLRAGYFKSEKIHHELIVVDHTIKRAQAVNAPGAEWQGSKYQGDGVGLRGVPSFTRWFIACCGLGKRIATDVKMETCEKSYCC
jgi:hypothetical protein